jgi:hypothetical protein
VGTEGDRFMTAEDIGGLVVLAIICLIMWACGWGLLEISVLVIVTSAMFIAKHYTKEGR